MAGQFGFQATDALPPYQWPDFAQEDIDDLGLEMCWRVYCRMNGWPEPEPPRRPSLLRRIFRVRA